MLESFSRMANRGSLIMVLTASAAAIIQESQSSTALNYRFLSREPPNFVIVPFSLANPQFGVLPATSFSPTLPLPTDRQREREVFVKSPLTKLAFVIKM